MSSSLMLFPITEHFTKSDRNSGFYLACGPETGPLIIFVHGWPDLGYGWRHQLRCLAALGFRCIALDMRGSCAATAGPPSTAPMAITRSSTASMTCSICSSISAATTPSGGADKPPPSHAMPASSPSRTSLSTSRPSPAPASSGLTLGT